MTLRVAALTSGLHTPSSRFRIRQHIAPLAEHDILVREFRPVVGNNVDNLLRPLRPKGTRIRSFPPIYPLYVALLSLRVAARVPGVVASWRYDLTWLERGLCDGWPTLERLLGKPLVLDVDDAVWLAEPFGARQMQRTAERADVVVVCNNYLADWFGRYCRRIELVPTPVDGDIFFPIDKQHAAVIARRFRLHLRGRRGSWHRLPVAAGHESRGHERGNDGSLQGSRNAHSGLLWNATIASASGTTIHAASTDRNTGAGRAAGSPGPAMPL